MKVSYLILFVLVLTVATTILYHVDSHGRLELPELGTEMTSQAEIRQPLTPPTVSYSNLPLRFEANQGQTNNQVRFLSRGPGYALFLTPTETVLSLAKPTPAAEAEDIGLDLAQPIEAVGDRTAIRIKPVGANATPRIVGLDELPGKSNCYSGNDPQDWRTGIATYAKVEYEDVYPGIDLAFYGSDRQLEYDFVVSPGADPQAIALRFEGADSLEIDSEGDLVLHTGDGRLIQKKPFIYQEINGVKQVVSGDYKLVDTNEVAFHVGAYDVNETLVIDPVLSYSTYLGGSTGFDTARAIVVNASGNAYVGGRTSSTDFPTLSPVQATHGGGDDAYVTKLSADGSTLLYSTYLGGGRNDFADGIALDSSDNVYITGVAWSLNFPVTPGAFQTAHAGLFLNDAYVAKLDRDGLLVYSTYLGGTGGEFANGIAVDSAGSAYVTGPTNSANFPVTVGAFQTFNRRGVHDAFVTKLTPDGSSQVYSTFLGGTRQDTGNSIVVDASGSAYVSGTTESSVNFPLKNALQPTHGGGLDAFVAKFNPAGSDLVYSTFLGGNNLDRGRDIDVDSLGNVYVDGYTASTNFPTASPIQATHGGGSFDAWIAKIDPAGSGLVYSTYLGGTGSDTLHFNSLMIDSAGSVYTAGSTTSPDFPTVDPLKSALTGVFDVFVTKLNPAGSAIDFSTFIGGSGSDFGLGIEVDASGSIYVAGATTSSDFPTVNPFQATNRGGVNDGFVLKISQMLSVDIDIKPGSFPNSINRRSRGNVPVALLSSEAFDSTLVNPTTVMFAGASPLNIGQGTEDVNLDGRPDVVFHFGTQSLVLPNGTEEACMTGSTFDGQEFKGCDSVRLVK